MENLTDLDLPFLPMESYDFTADPYSYIEEAREKHPWLAKCSHGIVVHDHSAIKDLLWMDDKMLPAFNDVVPIMGAEDLEWGRFQYNQMLNLVGEDHKRIRGIVADMFTPLSANKHRELMRSTMRKVLEEWVPKGKFDFEEFVSYFPISVMCALIGASTDMIPRLRDSMGTLTQAFSMNPDLMPEIEEAFLLMDDFVQKLVAERRAGQRLSEDHDLLDTLLTAVGNDGLSDRELYDLLVFLFVAGYDTSKNVMTLTMHALLDHPEIYERCATDIKYCRKVVEESLRFRSPTTVTRLLGEDIVYRDVLLPKGTMLWFTSNVSGRDPRSFKNPHDFNPDRDDEARNMAFGRGAHLCLGQFIARAQIEEGFHLIAQHIKNPKRAGPVEFRPFYGVGGIRGLPIEFEPVTLAPVC